jgi:hypothetical protein
MVVVLVHGVWACTKPASQGQGTPELGPTAREVKETAAPQCDSEAVQTVESYLESVPLKAVEMAEQLPGCDDKFALLYRAEVKMAAGSDESYYYNGKVNPQGGYGKEPNELERYVIEHSEHFETASEGSPIRAGDYWLRKIRDRKHEVLGEFELGAIRSLDEGVWEDGDGSMHTPELLREYGAWLEKWPHHPQAGQVRQRVEELRK